MIYVQYIMSVKFILLCFLLILYCVEVYTEEKQMNTVYARDSIQQDRSLVGLEVGGIYF